jgi:alpha-tubulin suppressor-like RCC1 family protein
MDNNSIELVCAKRRVTLDMMDKIECSSDHNLGIYDGKVYSWGRNNYGQLGDDSTTDRTSPVAVDTNGVLNGKTIVDISAGYMHSMCLDSDGVVYSWGYNASGQLGDATKKQRNVPVAVKTSGVLSGKTIIDISAGYYHSLALDSNGVVYSWGDNFYGQLGNGNYPTDSLIPVAVDTSGVLSGKTIVDISAGYVHSMCLDSNGVVYSWGDNVAGELGDGNYPTDSDVPVAVDTSGVLSGKKITSINGGSFYSMCLDSNGVLYGWGRNNYGQLGDGSKTPIPITTPVAVDKSGVLSGKTIVDISAGYINSMCLDSNGVVYSWGDNEYGQLGDGNYPTDSDVPVAVDTSGVLSGKKITSICAGSWYSMCLDSNGVLYGWGRNNYGQLGDGSTTDRTYPITVLDGIHNFEKIVSGYHFYLGLYKGEVWGWGRNNYGQLGNDTTIGIYTPVKMLQEEGLLLGKTIVDISAGTYHSLLLDSDGKMYSCGLNTSGQCGDGTTTSPRMKPVAVDTSGVLSGKKIVQISCGSYHNLALDSDGVVYSWGDNNKGQLGDNTNDNKSSPVAVDTSGVLSGKTITQVNSAICGLVSFCLDSDGKVYSWGDNTYSALGNNDYPNNQKVPVAVNTSGVLSGKTIVKISGNFTNGYVQDSNGVLYGWGYGGRVGDNSSNRRDVPVAIYTAGALSGKTITDFEAWQYGGMCIADGDMFIWGIGNDYALGTNSTSSVTAPTAVSKAGILSGKTIGKLIPGGARYNGCMDTEENTYFWGNNNYGNYGTGNVVWVRFPLITGATMIPTIEMMEKVCYGYSHCLGIYNGEVWAWGRNTYGQLGNNDATGATQTRPVKVLQESGVLLGKRVTDICTTDHSSHCIAEGVAYSWGYNARGQLGNNDATLASQIKPVAVYTAGALSGKTLVKLGGESYSHVIALDSDGKVYSWGLNNNGQLGNNDYPNNQKVPVAVDTSGVLSGKTITDIHTGYYHSVVLDSDGKVYSWGRNDLGQLGDNSTAARTSPVAVNVAGVLSGKTVTSIYAGGENTACIDSNNVGYIWGRNDYGQCGDGTTTSPRKVPVAVDTSGALSGKSISKFLVGYSFVYCLTTDGKVYVCGRNNYGQLGNGTTSNTPQDEFILWNSTGELEAQIGEYIAVDLAKAGVYSTSVILSDGTMYTSGDNNYGQLGVGNSTSPQTLPVKTKKTYRYYH